jgi:hypothetical protein
MIYIDGPSRTGKSSLPQIAAAICGDWSTALRWQTSGERMRQEILKAKSNGTFGVFNEVQKEGSASGRSVVSTLDFILNLTPQSLAHELYVGPVPIGELPVLVFTDTYVGDELRRDYQLARRIVHVELSRQVTWNFRQETFRVQSPELAEACNAVLSDVIDTYFTYPQTFEDIATALGFGTFATSEVASEGWDALRRLFTAVCGAQGIEGSNGDAIRWRGRGWKVTSKGTTTTLGNAWDDVCDPGGLTSRRCSEVQWSRLLGVDGDVRCEIRSHGNRIAIRFVRYRSPPGLRR